MNRKHFQNPTVVLYYSFTPLTLSSLMKSTEITVMTLLSCSNSIVDVNLNYVVFSIMQ